MFYQTKSTNSVDSEKDKNGKTATAKVMDSLALRPHLNKSLRAEIIFFTSEGIKVAALESCRSRRNGKGYGSGNGDRDDDRDDRGGSIDIDSEERAMYDKEISAMDSIFDGESTEDDDDDEDEDDDDDDNDDDDDDNDDVPGSSVSGRERKKRIGAITRSYRRQILEKISNESYTFSIAERIESQIISNQSTGKASMASLGIKNSQNSQNSQIHDLDLGKDLEVGGVEGIYLSGKNNSKTNKVEGMPVNVRE